MRKLKDLIWLLLDIIALGMLYEGVKNAYYYVSKYGASQTSNKWIIIASIGGGFLFAEVIAIAKYYYYRHKENCK